MVVVIADPAKGVMVCHVRVKPLGPRALAYNGASIAFAQRRNLSRMKPEEMIKYREELACYRPSIPSPSL